MDLTSLRSGSDYLNRFDPEAYLIGCYRRVCGLGSNEIVIFHLGSLYTIYKDGKVHGKRIIDIGSGPAIHSLIPAEKWFDELYLADYSRNNLNAIQKWLMKDPDCHDWGDFFRYFAEKDNTRDAYQRHEDLLRAKIKPLLTCDFHQPNPLYPQTMGDFDAVTSSFALISGCKDIVEYRTAMKHVTSLLQPRGHFIYATLLNSPFYTVGKEKFSTLSISMDEMQTALKDAGIEIVQLFEHRNKMNTDIVQYEGGVVVLGKKTHL